MKTSDNNKLTPLEELRLEKAILKQQCSEREERIVSGLSYLYNNMASLTISTVVGSVGRKVGLIQSKSEFASPRSQVRTNFNTSSSTVRETVMNGLKLTYPIIKPIVYGYIIDKIKGVFIPKRRKKKKR